MKEDHDLFYGFLYYFKISKSPSFVLAKFGRCENWVEFKAVHQQICKNSANFNIQSGNVVGSLNKNYKKALCIEQRSV